MVGCMVGAGIANGIIRLKNHFRKLSRSHLQCTHLNQSMQINGLTVPLSRDQGPMSGTLQCA